MKHSLLILYVLTVLNSFAFSAGLNFREQAFIENHRLAIEEEKCLDVLFNNLSMKLGRLFDGDAEISEDEIADFFPRDVLLHSYHPAENIVFQYRGLPGYIIKLGFNRLSPRKNLSRIIFADQIYHLVHDPQFGFSKVRLLHKKIYHRKSRPEYPLNDFNYVVLSPIVEGKSCDSIENLPKQHANEMFAVMHLLRSPGLQGFDFDAFPKGIFYTKDDQIVFVDTCIRREEACKWWLDRAFVDCRYKTELSEKEEVFIRDHEVAAEVKKLLDGIFSSIDKDLRSLLDGNIVLSPHEVVGLLQRNNFSILSDKDAWVRSLVLGHSKLPGYVMKIGLSIDDPRRAISRIIVADQINLVIEDEQHGITNVNPIYKKLYHRPGRPVALNDFNYVIICPKISGDLYDQASSIPRKTVEDCHVLVTRLNRSLIALDVAPQNIIIDEHGKAVFIDTEITKGFFRDNLLRRVLD